jgi:hypothetical protein
MTADLCEPLYRELERIAADRSCRVVVLTGAERGFCAGLDLGGFGSAPGNDATDDARDRLGNPELMSRLILRRPRHSPACHRSDQRPRRRLPPGARARLRHPLRRPPRRASRRLRQRRRLELRPRHELAPWGTRLTKQGMWTALEIPSEQAAVEYEDRQQIMATHGRAPARRWRRSWRSNPPTSPTEAIAENRARAPRRLRRSPRTGSRGAPPTERSLRTRRGTAAGRGGRAPRASCRRRSR